MTRRLFHANIHRKALSQMHGRLGDGALPRPQRPQAQVLLQPPGHVARLRAPARKVVGAHRAQDGAARVLRQHQARSWAVGPLEASHTGVP